MFFLNCVFELRLGAQRQCANLYNAKLDFFRLFETSTMSQESLNVSNLNGAQGIAFDNQIDEFLNTKKLISFISRKSFKLMKIRLIKILFNSHQGWLSSKTPE